MNKTKVGVIYGGRSGEHEVSLASALSVLKNIDRELFEVVPIAIDKQGQWWLNDLDDVLTANEQALVSSPKSTLLDVTLQHHNGSKSLKDICDVVFPVMHGPLYEDGAIQGLFIHAGIPFVGCSVLSSALSMDKHIQKSVVESHGVNVVKSQLILKPTWHKNPQQVVQSISDAFKYPVFIKPNSLGSSVGNAIAKTPEELPAAIDQAFAYDNAILIEDYIKAKEIELSVLRNEDSSIEPLVSIAGEISLADSSYEFYSYEAKYDDKSDVGLHIPASITPEELKEAQEIAKQVFILLRCEGMARVDLFYVPDTATFYFNEINTIPGFTKISMYPKLWEASGLPYQQLLTKLIHLAFNQYEQDLQIQRDWQ